ncbi:O-antigen ligase family protein [Gemmatimonadota bacterium]
MLVLAYILLIPFNGLLYLPLVGPKVQLTELLFPLLAFVAVRQLLRGPRPRFHLLDAAVLAWLLANTLSGLAAGISDTWLEILGTAYLVALYGCFRVLAPSWPTLRNGFLVAGSVAALLGIGGWILTHFGVETWLAWPSGTPYPYLGYVARAQALTTSPNMLASILAVPLLVVLAELAGRQRSSTGKPMSRLVKLAGLLCLTALLLTVSKLLVTVAMGALVVIVLVRPFPPTLPQRSLALAGIGLLLVLPLAATHVFFVDRGSTELETLSGQGYVTDQPFMTLGDRDLVWTNYAVNKSVSVEAFRRSPWLGVGPGQQRRLAGELREAGEYPARFPAYAPHSSYTGTLGELGVVGTAALLLLVVAVALQLRTAGMGERALPGEAWVFLVACLAAFAAEATVTDIMNFRHLWVLVGFLGVGGAAPIARGMMISGGNR